MKNSLCLLGVVIFLAALHNVYGVAVMSIDFGSEWMKIGIVSPGVPMEIALNKESKRKTPTVISLRENIRTYGEDAQTVGIRFPKNSYHYLLDLLGKDIDHPIVQQYKTRFPYHEIVEDKDRGTILFKHDEDEFYSPEELVAQLLHKAKHFAEQSAHQTITECVIIVPGYFNQVERKSMLQAAELADLKVLQLMNDHMAVALNYGIFKSKEFNETAQYVMFYDMGATSTTATIISMQLVKTKERGYVETNPQIAVVGLGYDRTLGGLEIQLRLRDHLAKKFNEMKKTSNDVLKNARSMAKLLKEAGRVKNVLSANSEHYAQIEGLLDEQDFKVLVTRDELENMAKDVLERVPKPVEQALKTAGLSADVLNQVVIVGGGTRVPKVQEILKNTVKQDIAKNLNADEAAAMGAVYKAADLSMGFKVKKFVTKDAVLFPIQVIFERESEGAIKQVKRTLFNLMNPYPQKKKITFNKRTADFSFNVNYADLDYLQNTEVLNIGSLNLTQIKVKGVAEAIDKHTGSGIESKGITAHFALDESGILNLINIEYVVEKTVLPEDEEEGTLSKLGSTISKLFGADDAPTEEKPVHEDPEPSGATEKPELNEGETKEESKQNATKKNATSTKDTEEKEAKEHKPKVVTVKEPINSKIKCLSIEQMSPDNLKDSIKKIEALNKIEKELNRRASALNNLETFVIDVQNRLYENEYAECVTDEEKENIVKTCSETSDWIYEDGADADANTYEQKLSSIKTLTRGFYLRVFEHKERPEALGALASMLNSSRNFMEFARNHTKGTDPDDDGVFTEVELETLGKLITSTEEWRDKKVEEQDALKKHEPIVLTVKMLSEKMQGLDREVKYLVNKFKMWKPKKVEKEIPVKEETIPKDSEATKDENKTETSEEKPFDFEEVAIEDDEVLQGATTEEIKPTEIKEEQKDDHSEL